MKLATNQNAILIALTSANVDIANSESLKFSKRVDPKGERTICVVTKIDLYEGSNKQLEKLLNNEIVVLKQGFVFTTLSSFERNYSSKEQLLAKLPALKPEENFGKRPLLKKLSFLLGTHMKAAIPSIKNNLQIAIKKLEKEATVFKTTQFSKGSDKRTILLDLIKQYVARAYEFLYGMKFELGMELQGAALINEIIEEKFRKEISTLTVGDTLQEEDILVTVKNTNGFHPSLFISQKAFETLSKHLINKLMPVSLECADLVALELTSLFKKIDVELLSPFPELHKDIQQTIGQLISDRLEPTKKFINQFFEVESGFINTKHPDFIINATESITNPQDREERPKDPSLSKREQTEILLIKQMLGHYFDLVKKNICDYIPKIVLTLLVSKTIDSCEHTLIINLYQPEKIDRLLKLAEDSQAKMDHLLNELENMKECLKLLNNICD